MSNTNYLDKRKIAGIEKRARGLVASENTWGNVLAGAIIAAFIVSTVHLMGELRGWGFMGWVLGILSSVGTEGQFLYHRYRSFPGHENKAQKWSALVGLTFALIGSLFFFGADILLLIGMLNTAKAGPVAAGVMIVVLISAIVTESIYQLASHVSAYDRQKRGDALEVLKISDNTRLELDKGDLEIMLASADLVLAEMFQRADSIRKAIPATLERSEGQAEILAAEDIRDQIDAFNPEILNRSNGNGPKVKA